MFFRQIYDEGLAQASYIVGDPESGEALVVDPRRDFDVFVRIAEENDLKITAVTETHIHADFLSGARELAARCDAVLYLSGEGDDDWRYTNLLAGATRIVRDGDIIGIGDVSIRVMHTPGHTPEHLTFVVSDGGGARGPMIAMTGDFVFVGDIGRPDLLEEVAGVAGAADASARTMFASLRDKFSAIPDYVQIWPGHGAGSACGKALGAVPASTAGYERLTSWWAPLVSAGSDEEFTRELLAGQPDAPAYFLRMKRLNRDGPPPLAGMPKPERLTGAKLRAQIGGSATIVDARDNAFFRLGHIRNALSIPDLSTFSTRAAWFVPSDTPIVLVAKADRIDGLVRALGRVGLDRIAGYVDAEDAGATDGVPLDTLAGVDVAAARSAWDRNAGVILDVRTTGEFRHGHIPGALNIPAQKLVGALARIPNDRPVYVHCAGGGRANAAASVLRANGFERAVEVLGGFDAWEAAGNPVERN